MRKFARLLTLLIAAAMLIGSFSFTAVAETQLSHTVFSGERVIEGWFPSFITEYAAPSEMAAFLKAAQNPWATIEVTYTGDASVGLLLQSYPMEGGNHYSLVTYDKCTLKTVNGKKVASFSADGLLSTYTSAKHEDDGSNLRLDRVMNFGIGGSGNTVYSVVVKWSTDAEPELKIDTTQRHQTMDGWGASYTWYGDWLTNNNNKEQGYDWIFNDCEFNILRFRDLYKVRGYGGGYEDTSYRAYKDYYNAAVKRGIKPIVLVTSWGQYDRELDFVAYTERDSNGKAYYTLAKDANGEYMYEALAQHCVEAIQLFFDAGLPVDYFSISNETELQGLGVDEVGNAKPDSFFFGTEEDQYHCCYWKAHIAIYNAFREAFGDKAPSITGAEVMADYSYLMSNYLNPLIANGGGNMFDTIAHHLYGSANTPSTFSEVYRNFGNYKLWQTEWYNNDYIKHANTLIDELNYENITAYLYWNGVWIPDEGNCLIEIGDWPANAYIKRRANHYTMMHFSKFIKEGYTRVETTPGLSNSNATSFISPDGKRVVTVVLNSSKNTEELKMNIPGCNIASSQVYRTTFNTNYYGNEESLNTYFVDMGSLTNGSVVLPQNSLTTIVMDIGNDDTENSHYVYSGSKPLNGWYPSFITQYRQPADMAEFISDIQKPGATIEITYSGDSAIRLMLQSYPSSGGNHYTGASYGDCTVTSAGDGIKVATFSAADVIANYTSTLHEDDSTPLRLDNVLNFGIDGYNDTVFTVLVKWNEEPVASLKHGQTVTEHPSLADAVANAQNGDLVTLLSDISVDTKVSVNKDITVDLNGMTINLSGGPAFNVASGSKLTLIDSIGTGGIVSDASNSYILSVSGALDISNCALSGSKVGIYSSRGEIIVRDGTVINSVTGINASGGTVIVGGGSITASESGITAYTGTVMVSGGEITSTSSTYANSFGSIKGSAIVAVSSTSGETLVTVSGGTLNGIAAVSEINLGNFSNTLTTLDIYGGTFNGNIASADCTGFISGGSFPAEVNADFCAEGYAPAASGSRYTVSPVSEEASIRTGIFSGEKLIETWYPSFIAQFDKPAAMAAFIEAIQKPDAVIEVTYAGSSDAGLLLQSYPVPPDGTHYTYATYNDHELVTNGSVNKAVFSAEGLIAAYTSTKHDDDGSNLSLDNILNFSIGGENNTVLAVDVRYPNIEDDGTTYVVAVSSGIRGMDATVVNVSGGGDNITASKGTLVSAPEKSGYTFLGWYTNDYGYGTALSKDYSFIFRPSGDPAKTIRLYAVYEANASFNLTVVGSKFTVNGGTEQEYSYSVDASGLVTVEFTGKGNFLYWVNASNNIVSTQKSYSFTMVAPTTVTAISINDTSSPNFFIVFRNAYNQILSHYTAGRINEIKFPTSAPSKMGSVFTNWDINGNAVSDPADVWALISDGSLGHTIEIIPKYTQESKTFELTVRNSLNSDSETFTVYAGQPKKVTAEETMNVNGKAYKFSHWELNGNTVSYSLSFTVLANDTDDKILTAVYVSKDSAVEVAAVANITQMYAAINGAKYKITTTMQYNVPEDATVIQIGFVYSANSAYKSKLLTLDGEGVGTNISEIKTTSGIHTLNINTSDSEKTVYIRGYVVYELNGETFTLYTSQRSGSYTSLTSPEEPGTGFFLSPEMLTASQDLGISLGSSTAAAYKTVGNVNPLSSNVFFADPTSVEYNGRLYVYGTSDQQQYDSNNGTGENNYGNIKKLACFSTDDMINWTYHGDINVGEICRWAWCSWAPSIVSREKNGKTEFFLYFCNSAGGIGVMTSDSPTGPWVDPIGRPLIAGDTNELRDDPVYWCFDPGVVIDDNGVGWLAFGGGDPKHDGETGLYTGNCRLVRLGEDMISLDSKIIVIKAPYHLEANELNYINGKYILTYCSNWYSRDEWPSVYDPSTRPELCTMCYMVSEDPLDPDSWVYMGQYLKNPTAFGYPFSNNHSHLQKFKDKYYIFYQTVLLLNNMNIPDASGYRSVGVDEIAVNEATGVISNGRMSNSGPDRVKAFDPYVITSGSTTNVCAAISFQGSGNDCFAVANSGSWIAISGADFGNGAKKFAASVSGRGVIDIRIDSLNGQSIGSIQFDTGSGTETVWNTLDLNVSGEHDIYLVFGGNVVLKGWQFA